MRTHRSFGTPISFVQMSKASSSRGVDRGPELVLRQAVVDREELPRELDRVALEVVAEAEVAQHLEERVVARGIAHVLEVVVLAAGAHAALRGDRAVVRTLLRPRNTSLNWFMPALVKSSVGSLPGTSELEATGWWPFEAK
jgi:hypothetical protein